MKTIYSAFMMAYKKKKGKKKPCYLGIRTIPGK